MILLDVLALVALAAGCTDSSGNGAGPGGAGHSGTGGGSGQGGSGGASAGSAGAGAGAAGTSAGAGGATAGSGGTTVACGEPASCEGYDDRPDAGLAAEITCISPSAVPANTAVRIAIYGHHLATGPNNYAIVVLDNGTPLNGVPATACHIDVDVPPGELATPRAAAVVVSPGGWVRSSAPGSLTIQ